MSEITPIAEVIDTWNQPRDLERLLGFIEGHLGNAALADVKIDI